MSTTYYTAVTLHVFAAIVWLGGMFFLALVGAPVLRRIESPALRQELFTKLGVQARRIGWWAIAVLVVTGTIVLHERGLLRWDVLGRGAFWGTPLGSALAWKLGSVVAMLAVSGIHDFVVGPAAGRVVAGTPDALALRRRAALLARGSAFIGIIIVIAAVRLARGG